eukprot:TRINITY_DN42_c0_g2_i1.p2 TRINITY_DN42_c0_g2~~TRINITY_DN42_c0_g2_i1.p2  ORF type:complete len:126 (-),score=39.34 TRINITY_DN42_c0_g2_i1:1344-1721(-)
MKQPEQEESEDHKKLRVELQQAEEKYTKVRELNAEVVDFMARLAWEKQEKVRLEAEAAKKEEERKKQRAEHKARVASLQVPFPYLKEIEHTQNCAHQPQQPPDIQRRDKWLRHRRRCSYFSKRLV